MRQYKISPNATALEFIKNELQEPVTPILRDSSGLREAHPNTIKTHSHKIHLDSMTEIDMNMFRNHINLGQVSSEISYKPKKLAKKTYSN